MEKSGIMRRKVEQAWSSEGNYVIMSRQAGTAPATFQLFHNIIIPFGIHKDDDHCEDYYNIHCEDKTFIRN